MRKSYNIIYEDNDIVVLDKKGGVLTVPDRFDPTKKNLKSMMINRFGNIYVVHRLDFETSGVILFAKNEKSHQVLSEQFESRTVKKEYLALTKKPNVPKGNIDARIDEHPSKKGNYIISQTGKSALSEYEVIKAMGKYALLSIRIHTGRTHQIRVHLKHSGAPLITDNKYGLYSAFYLSQLKKIKLGKYQTEKPLLERSSLHSSQLTITHPSLGREMTFNAPLHKDMKAVIYQLEKIQSYSNNFKPK